MAALSNEIGDWSQTCPGDILSVFLHLARSAKFFSHVNFISYTLKVDILCKLAAAPLQHRPQV